MLQSIIMLTSATYMVVTHDIERYQYMPLVAVVYGLIDTPYHLFLSNKKPIHRLGLVLHHLCLIGQGWVVKNPIVDERAVW